MPTGLKLSLKKSNSWLMVFLRVMDCGISAVLLYPIVLLYIGYWSEHYETLMLLTMFISLFIFHFGGLYRPWRGQDYFGEFKTILTSWITIVGCVLFLLFAFKVAARYSRVVLVYWFVITPVLLMLVHGLARGFLRRVRARGRNLKTAIVVGAGDLGILVARYIHETPWAGTRVLGFFDDTAGTWELRRVGHAKKPILGNLSDLPEYLKTHHVDLVYITLSMRLEEEIYWILGACRTLGSRIYFVPDLYAFRSFNTRLQRFGDLLMFDFNPDSDWKRLFDICFSALVLLFTLPLTLLIGLMIKLQDGGPVFYGHQRITCAGKKFSCLKFRTMRVDADQKLKDILTNDPEAREEWNKTFKLKNDPRVTWIGRFLRKTSLDELPQFLNVLKGDMSVVGARPIVQCELRDYYGKSGGMYCSIKPGITGPWQVTKRSDTEDYGERVQLDTWYVLNHSFWLDLQIIYKTIGCMIKGKGAY